MKIFEVTAPVKQWAPGVLGMGSRGPEVQALQKQLGIPEDGMFGPQTKAAVEELQKKLGVTVDGAYGPVTKKAHAASQATTQQPTAPVAPQAQAPATPAATATPAPAPSPTQQPAQAAPTQTPAPAQPADTRPTAPKFSIQKTSYGPLPSGEQMPPHYTVTDIQRGVHVYMGDNEQEARSYVAQHDPEGAAQTRITANESLDRILKIAGLK